MSKSQENYERLKFQPKSPEVTGAWIECETCKQPFYVPPSRLRQVERKGHTIRYCSLKCRDYSGAKNPFFGKKHDPESIKKMMEHPNHPKFVSGPTNPNIRRFGHGFKGQTREWWRAHLIETVGRCERCDYQEYPNILELHHIDRNKRNNHRDNLLLLCPICHRVDHLLAGDGQYSSKKNG